MAAKFSLVFSLSEELSRNLVFVKRRPFLSQASVNNPVIVHENKI